MNQVAEDLLKKINDHTALVGIIGLGYVGLPLALAFTEKGFNVLGLDIDPEKAEKLNKGESYIKHLDQKRVAIATGNLPTNEAPEETKFNTENASATSAMDCDDNSSFIIHNSSLPQVHNSELTYLLTSLVYSS